MPRIDATVLVFGLISLILVFFLTGCSTVGTTLDNTQQWRADTVQNLVRINDRFLSDAEIMLCQGASKGALDRRYGINSDTADAYNRFCGITSKGRILIESSNGP